MTFDHRKIIIKENKNNPQARFYLSYTNNRNDPDTKAKSYQILSRLAKGRAVIMEVNTSLTTLESKEKEPAIYKLVTGFREMEIDYRYQKYEANESGKTLLGLFSFKTMATVHSVFAYIPEPIWEKAQFRELLPTYGARYYICNEQSDAKKLFEDFASGRILDCEKTDLFVFIIFDSSDFGQMGVNTKLPKAELEKLLEV
ncbi:MAG: hypothetical protein ACM3X9_14330 [Bacillota bacterium]